MNIQQTSRGGYLGAFLSCLYRVNVLGPRKILMVGYDVIWLEMHVLFSTLQSTLMHVISLFLSTSATVSNSASRFWHGSLWENGQSRLRRHFYEEYVKYLYLLPRLSVTNRFVSWRLIGWGLRPDWRGKLENIVNQSFHALKSVDLQFTSTGECVSR